MKRSTLLLALFIANLFSLQGQTSLENLMPLPVFIEAGMGKYRIENSFTVKVEGVSSSRISSGVSGMVRRLGGRTGFFLPQVFFNFSDSVADPDLIIEVSRPGRLEPGEDESYTLKVEKENILIMANTDLGALHGLETFLQLLDSDDLGYFLPAVSIKDEPRFPWRGLSMDVCRHFIPLEKIRRNLDGMAAAKMNVFHWHLSENQGFRVECKTYPKLHELGSNGQYYTQEEIKDIILYASDRGIRVVPEFDLPGHATSWFVGYPELASMPGPYKIETAFGIFDPTFNVSIEETYVFLDAFFKEMCALFPDAYMHIGGDENNGIQWGQNEQIQSYMEENGLADKHALQAYFNTRLLKILSKYGKKMIGWDEILQPDMPKDIVIQSWRGLESMVEAVNGGYQTILSHGYYVDLTQTTEYHYLNDPAPEDADLTPGQKELILGGEACMWAEIVDYETIDSRIWPRTAAIAERLWSPAHIRDVDDMYRRLKVFSFHLEELGLTHEKNIPYLLRRLSANAPIETLRTLLDVIEPVKGYSRAEQRAHYTYSSMSRFVDAARPDAETARVFRKMVSSYLNGNAEDENLAAEILVYLNIWKDNHKTLEPIIQSSPILWEIESLSEDLSTCGQIGLEAMDFIQSARPAPADWAVESWEAAYRAFRPRGQCELMIVSAIQEMIDFRNPEFSVSPGDNSLSGKEIAEGWSLLFDGKSLENWRVPGKEHFSHIWGVKEGMLCSLGSKKKEDVQGDDLFSKDLYGYFEFSLDWKVIKGGSSGVYYLCEESGALPGNKARLQMQICDEGKQKCVAGSLWDLIPANPPNAKPAGEWNTSSVRVWKNGQILHILNGKTVVEYYPGESWFVEWDKIVAESSFKGLPFIINPPDEGYIGIQNQGEGVFFKNIKIRKLIYQ